MTQKRVTLHRCAYSAVALFLLLSVSAIAWRTWHDAPANIVAHCKTTKSPSVCYSEKIQELLVHRGLGAAFDAVAYVYANDSRFASGCHGEMHVLGANAYDLFAQQKPVELNDKASSCGYGFYHGFMQSLLYATHDYTEARAFCAYAGTQVPYPEGYAEGACYHGIGHGFTDGGDQSLQGDPVAIAEPGLDICEQVTSEAAWQSRCYSGVFNSMAILAQDPEKKLDMHGDPYFFCKTPGYSTLERQACYAEMNTLVVAMSERNIDKGVAFIDTIADPAYRLRALESALAAYGAGERESAHLSSMVARVCGRYTTPVQEVCVGAFVSGMLEMGTPGSQHVAVLALCSAPELTTTMQGACYTQLIDVPQVAFNKTITKTMCNATPSQYRATLKTCATL